MKLVAEELETAKPWQALLLRASFPLESEAKLTLTHFLDELTRLLLAERHDLRREVFLHAWKLEDEELNSLFHQNLSRWKPSLGLGIWPDRKGPSTWTEASFMDASATKMTGEQPELPAYKFFHLGGEPQHTLQAANLIFGLGATTQMFTRDSFDALQKKGKKVYLPAITSQIYKHADFYLPLLDQRSIAFARRPGYLDELMCGVDVYIRESPEDEGVLILSRIPLTPLMEQIREAESV